MHKFPTMSKAGLMLSFLNKFDVARKLPYKNWESVEKQWLPGSSSLMHCALESKPALCCPGVSARIGTSKRSRMG